MLRKRAVLYFLIMGFPIGLGAAAPSWLTLPRLLPATTALISAADTNIEESIELPIDSAQRWDFPDFGAIHPLVVGSFTLLFCTGVLLAADQPRSTRPR